MKTNIRLKWPLLFLIVLIFVVSPHLILAQEEKTDLTLELVPDSYYNKVTPGEYNVFFLEVRNTGSQAFTNIRLISDEPEDWIIEFEPASITYLGPGNFQTVDLNIKPASNAYRGEHRVTLIAEADGA